MSSLVTRAQSSRYRRSSSRLPFEALLSIFSNFDSHEIVVMRRCCKRWKEIIDNNKSLWRVLDWIQEKDGSAIQAVEKFDEKSASTLKEVSIFQGKGQLEVDNRLLGVLDRSKKSLTDLSFAARFSKLDFRFRLEQMDKMIELASNCNHLESLVLWSSQDNWLSLLPKTRLTRTSRQPYLDTEGSSNLQVLWCWNGVEKCNGKLNISSLVSFADPVCHFMTIYRTSHQHRSFFSNFSSTLIHLSIHSGKDVTQSLSCPALRILEGQFSDGFPSWLDAPNLRVVIANFISPLSLLKLPISVEELWLLSCSNSPREMKLDFLLLVCPQLKVLKVGKNFLVGDRYMQSQLGSKDVSESFKAREEKVREGVEIEGIQMKSLEKIVVPTEFFEPEELDGLRDFGAEVIDIKEYPDFIDLEY